MRKKGYERREKGSDQPSNGRVGDQLTSTLGLRTIPTVPERHPDSLGYIQSLDNVDYTEALDVL